MRDVPGWMILFAPLPPDATPERKPVASAEQIANGTDGPIAGWERVTVDLSEPCVGLRNILVMLDANGQLLSAGDYVMVTRSEMRDGIAFTISDHESLGGRFEEDGSFKGTRWTTHIEAPSDSDDVGDTASTPSTPTEEEIAALRRIIADVLSRDADLRSR